ncbi:MAG: alpha-acetolactate decarboxylase [Bacteroidetes bacterium]|jgi:acetolactate decarboxylase|nr:alpha-acetolactate decarboxylase [Bacteroidota bacterium]
MKALFFSLVLLFLAVSCRESIKLNEVQSVSAMKNVMWKGELGAKIQLDTLNKNGLYGIGPLEGLAGEITIVEGQIYISTVDDNNQIRVEKQPHVGAPFFVYTNAEKFKEIKLPEDVTNLNLLNKFLSKNHDTDNAYMFKLKGQIESGKIHVQNLPPNTKVSSPKEAHQGQVDFEIDNKAVEMIGFYSNSAHGVYTHHDTNIHVHLITKDKTMMGHCDATSFNPKSIKLYLPTGSKS